MDLKLEIWHVKDLTGAYWLIGIDPNNSDDIAYLYRRLRQLAQKSAKSGFSSYSAIQIVNVVPDPDVI
jgi:hypothetical protein